MTPPIAIYVDGRLTEVRLDNIRFNDMYDVENRRRRVVVSNETAARLLREHPRAIDGREDLE